MKHLLLVVALLPTSLFAWAQSDQSKYPDPEFNNEVYLLKKDSSKLVRLEKGISKMDTKVKAAGFGGSESGYEIDGVQSTVRLSSGSGLSFIFTNGSTTSSNVKRDSMMRANGVDLSMMHQMNEPGNMITLYKADATKDKRKIYLQKNSGAFSFNHKNQSSDKYTFSVRKIRDGYWELDVDKSLPKGEYVFTMMNMGMGNMDGSQLLFAFAVD